MSEQQLTREDLDELDKWAWGGVLAKWIPALIAHIRKTDDALRELLWLIDANPNARVWNITETTPVEKARAHRLAGREKP